MATFGSADNVTISKRNNVMPPQPLNFNVGQPLQNTITNYTSFNTGEVSPAYRTTYTGYTGHPADHANTQAAPRISFTNSPTSAAINNAMRVSSPIQPTIMVQEQPVRSTIAVAAPPPNNIAVEAAPVQHVQAKYHHQSLSTQVKDDNFLCSRCCWILAALIGLILLMLALLWGLGVFGGEGKASGMNPPWKSGSTNVVKPKVTHPQHPKDASATTHPSYVLPTVVEPVQDAPLAQQYNVKTSKPRVPTARVIKAQPVFYKLHADSVQPQAVSVQPQAVSVQPQAVSVQPQAVSVQPHAVHSSKNLKQGGAMSA